MKTILVTGTARFYERLPQRAARMVGVTLAQVGFQLVTGNATGVDRWAAESFCAELARREINPAETYRQLCLPYLDRGSLWPLPGFSAPSGSRVSLKNKLDWSDYRLTPQRDTRRGCHSLMVVKST